jgi:hypothetical protein
LGTNGRVGRTKPALARPTKTYCGPGVRKSDGNRITITKQTQQAAVEAVQQRAAERAAELAAIIKELQVGGAESLRAIAEGPNSLGIPTAGGKGQWSAVQVQWILERL